MIVDILRAIATAAGAAAPLLPGVGPAIAGAIGAAIGLAADIAAAGNDPVAEITRIRRTDPSVKAVEDTWAAAIAKRFPEP